ncbi:uncharacterized protein LOC135417529 [Pseudopipra pipra]|uniref:uncharacterized protein LOC135417529 n=1 Tax=Pseudopipra pipra TaxID=415032 RepID=UPI003138B8B9
MVCQFSRCIWREETIAMGAGGMASSDLCNAETSAALLDLLVENGVSSAEKVPAFVRYIHRWLTANVCAERRLDRTLLALVEAHPVDVVVTLLRSAPCCDRAAVSMWRAIISLRTTAESVLTILALVLGSWPACSMRTSDGDEAEVFALAATVALWKILHLLCCTRAVRECFPNLFVHLLFQVFFSTVQMPEEVDTLWRECRKQHSLPTKPNRFAVLTLKALLHRLRCESVVVALERKCGWDTLLNADTHHYAVGLLAREMGSFCTPWCCSIVCCLLELLSEEMCPWELPAMVFLVEALVYLDVRECGESVLPVFGRATSRHFSQGARASSCGGPVAFPLRLPRQPRGLLLLPWAGALEARPRDLVTRSFGEESPGPAAGALEARPQDLVTRSFGEESPGPAAGALEAVLWGFVPWSFSLASPIPAAAALEARL